MRIVLYSLLMLTAAVSANAQKPAANPAPPDPQPSTPVVYVLGRVRTPSAVALTPSTTALRAIEHVRSGRAQDISLQASDIVEVRSRKRERFDRPEGPIPCNPPQATRIIY